MTTMHSFIKPVIIFFFAVWYVDARDPRNAQELTRCVRMAEPLIHDPKYVFPLTVQEIRNVCTMWDEFVECVRDYTNTFLTQPQQAEFQKAINPSMESIHQLCIQDPKYEKAYLHYAPCMKKISIEKRFCGNHYNLLARIAESSTETGPAICCGYHKFRSCVLQEASRECDKGDEPAMPTSGTDSSHFVSSMLNRALGFLLQKCSGYEPSSEDCLSHLNKTNGGSYHPSSSNLRNNSSSANLPNRNAYNAVDYRDRNSRLDNTELDAANAASINDNERGRPKTGSANAQLPDNPWNAAGFLPSNIGSAATGSKLKPDPVTLQPRPAAGINKFTWTTASPRAFFPTSANDFENEIPRSQRYKGSGESRISERRYLYVLTAAVIILAKYFGQNDFDRIR